MRSRHRRRRSRTWCAAALAVLVGMTAGAAAVRGGQIPQAAAALAASRPADVPGSGFEAAGSRLDGAPAPRTGSTAYRFATLQDGTQTPVTYDPCRPIHYVIRPDGAPADGEALIHRAVAQVGAATGLRFVSDGLTTEAPTADRAAYQPDRYGNRWAPVLVAWVTASENPAFTVDIAGLAGSVRISWGDHPARYVTGVVQLDATKLAATLASPAGPRAAENVILHELGHLVGLAHVDDPGQLMFPRAADTPGYSAGDLAGLARLGSGDCAPWL